MSIFLESNEDDVIYTTMKIPFSLKNSSGDYVLPNTSNMLVSIYIDDTSESLGNNQYALTLNSTTGDYLLEIKPDNIPFNEYLRVYIRAAGGSVSFVPKKFTILQLYKPLSEEITVAPDATIINIPFHLLEKAYWNDESNATIADFQIYVYPDGAYYDPENTNAGIPSSYYTITHIDQGDYNLELNYSGLCSDIETDNSLIVLYFS